MMTAARTTPAKPTATAQCGNARARDGAGSSVGTEIRRTDSIGAVTLNAGISPMGSGISQATSAPTAAPLDAS